MGTLDGRVAVITGAGRGQGRSHAITLAREGAKIVAADIDFQIASFPYSMNSPDDLNETTKLVEDAGSECLAVHADVRDAGQVDAMVSAALDRFGGVDIMISNAGGWSPSTIADMTDEAWQAVLDVNLNGAFHCIRSVAGPMIGRGGGRIVVISSVLSRRGAPNMANYVASRWGQVGLVKTAAMELGPHNITVNAVCPSTVETQQVTNDIMWKLFRPDLDNPSRSDAETVLRSMSTLSTAWIQPQDVSNMVGFLVSDAARFITGTAFDVAAGWSAQYSA